MSGEPQFQTSRLLLSTAILLVSLLAIVFVMPLVRPGISPNAISAQRLPAPVRPKSQPNAGSLTPQRANDRAAERAEAFAADQRGSQLTAEIIQLRQAIAEFAEKSAATASRNHSVQDEAALTDLRNRLQQLDDAVDSLRQENRLTRELMQAHKDLALNSIAQLTSAETSPLRKQPDANVSSDQTAAPQSRTIAGNYQPRTDTIRRSESTQPSRNFPGPGTAESSEFQHPAAAQSDATGRQYDAAVAKDFTDGDVGFTTDADSSSSDDAGMDEPLPPNATAYSTLMIKPRGQQPQLYQHFSIPDVVPEITPASAPDVPKSAGAGTGGDRPNRLNIPLNAQPNHQFEQQSLFPETPAPSRRVPQKPEFPGVSTPSESTPKSTPKSTPSALTPTESKSRTAVEALAEAQRNSEIRTISAGVTTLPSTAPPSTSPPPVVPPIPTPQDVAAARHGRSGTFPNQASGHQTAGQPPSISRGPNGLDMTAVGRTHPLPASERNQRIKEAARANAGMLPQPVPPAPRSSGVRFEHSYQFSTSAEPIPESADDPALPHTGSQPHTGSLPAEATGAFTAPAMSNSAVQASDLNVHADIRPSRQRQAQRSQESAEDNSSFVSPALAGSPESPQAESPVAIKARPASYAAPMQVPPMPLPQNAPLFPASDSAALGDSAGHRDDSAHGNSADSAENKNLMPKTLSSPGSRRWVPDIDRPRMPQWDLPDIRHLDPPEFLQGRSMPNPIRTMRESKTAHRIGSLFRRPVQSETAK